ncbi:MAG: phosphoglycerate kinase [Caldisericia bacterium]|nr:phosphoglycerate kinase [Caldisericia bacterium]
MKLRTLKNVDLKGKRVLYRVDYNVPLTDDFKVRDDTRIRETLPTIKYMKEQGAKIIILTHLGRPKGERKKEFSLKPVRDRLSELLGEDVKLVDDIYSEEAKIVVSSLKEGEVLMFENLRFYPGEEKNDESFAEYLSEFGDIFVSDAFAVSHRENTSVFMLPSILPSYAGFLMEKEVNILSKLIENPERPYIVIIGGAKISDKIGVLKNLVNKVDAILIGGGSAFTFLKAEGYNIGSSIYEREMEIVAKEIIEMAAIKNVKLLLPVDVHATEELKEGKDHEIVPIEKIPYDWYGVDIGPKTIELFKEEIRNAKTIFWSGPLGVYEMELYSNGTREIAKAISEIEGIKVVGGGDTISALNKFNLIDKITHVSTGGGALLEFLEGKILPGIKVLLEE